MTETIRIDWTASRSFLHLHTGMTSIGESEEFKEEAIRVHTQFRSTAPFEIAALWNVVVKATAESLQPL